MFGVPGPIEAKILLQRFLEARDEKTAESLLERLLSRHCAPLLQRALRRKRIEGEEAEEVYSRTMERIIAYLSRARVEGRRDTVRHLPSFVTTLAGRALTDLLREKYPERHRLRHRIRYMLDHQPELATWQCRSGRTVCGLATWRDEGREPESNARVRRLRNEPRAAAEEGLPDVDPTQARLAELVYGLICWVGCPIEVEKIVHAVAACQGIRDMPVHFHTAVDDDELLPDAYEEVVDPQADVSGIVQQKETLRRLWTEIGRLTARQRAALLLGTRELDLFVHLCIVPLSEIAAALEMSWEQFAAVWSELPLEDRHIAEQLGVTTENVRYQRHTARARLTERLEGAAF